MHALDTCVGASVSFLLCIFQNTCHRVLVEGALQLRCIWPLYDDHSGIFAGEEKNIIRNCTPSYKFEVVILT